MLIRNLFILLCGDRLQGASTVAAWHMLDVPAWRRDAEPPALPARGQRATGARGARGALPGLLARHRPPARGVPAGPLRAPPRRAAGRARARGRAV